MSELMVDGSSRSPGAASSSAGAGTDREHQFIGVASDGADELSFFTWRQQIANILDRPESSALAQGVHYSLIGLIFVATTLTILETVPEMREHMSFFIAMDYLVTALFTLELSLRFWVVEDMGAFCANPYNAVDFVALLPGYVQLLLLLSAGDLVNMHEAVGSMRTLRIIRVFRLARVIRVVRLVNDWAYAQQLALLLKVMCQVAHTGLHVIFLLLGLTTIAAACLMFVLEIPECSEDDSTIEVSAVSTSLQGTARPAIERLTVRDCTQAQFDSIPAAYWWAVTTLTTVGYGDMVPITIVGKLVAGVMCVCAVAVISVAAAQFTIHFRERWLRAKATENFRRRSADSPIVAKEQAEIEALMSDFQASLDDLLAKLSSCTSMVALADERLLAGHSPSPNVVPWLQSVKEHAAALGTGLSAYVYEALGEAMLVEHEPRSGSKPGDGDDRGPRATRRRPTV